MVIQFDLSTIPSDVTVTEATFEMYKYGNYSGYSASGKQNIFLVTTEWQESGTTWSSPWSTAGGDFESSPIAQYQYDGSSNGWHDFDVTSVIEDFLADPGSNYGFLLYPSTSNDYENYYHSSEYSTQSDRPKLTITYEEPNSIVNAKSQKNEQISVKYKDVYMVYTPFAGTVSITDIRGRQLVRFNAETANQWYQLPSDLSSGMHILTLTSQGRSVSQKVQLVR